MVLTCAGVHVFTFLIHHKHKHMSTCAHEHILQIVLIISLFCNGLYIITRPGMLFEFLDRWLYQLIFPKRSQDIKPFHTQLYKPILGCIKCMASVWGIFICLVMLKFSPALLFQIPVICICASALNAILFQLYE